MPSASDGHNGFSRGTSGQGPILFPISPPRAPNPSPSQSAYTRQRDSHRGGEGHTGGDIQTHLQDYQEMKIEAREIEETQSSILPSSIIMSYQEMKNKIEAREIEETQSSILPSSIIIS